MSTIKVWNIPLETLRRVNGEMFVDDGVASSNRHGIAYLCHALVFEYQKEYIQASRLIIDSAIALRQKIWSGNK